MKRLTIEEMRELAKSRGGKCLSEKYINAHNKLKWQCDKGHEWDAVYYSVKRGCWCPCCFKIGISLTIGEMKEIAKSRGGVCLSDKYVNISTKLRWQCSEGHIWEAIPNNIKENNTWCPVCNNRGRGENGITIDDANEIAYGRGGECLSLKYVSGAKLKWKCNKGHVWKSLFASIKREHWCPYCAGSIVTLADMKKLAEGRKGKCLSDNYINGTTKLRWQCEKKHIWYTRPHNVKSGQWCPICGFERTVESQRFSIDDAIKLGKERGGRCLSLSYYNARSKLKWECKKGHQWEATFASIFNHGSWCPVCSQSISERVCRGIFELIFKKNFTKKRLAWMLNFETKRKLELDGYCEELNLAFEYQGIQHFKKMFWHKYEHTLEKQKERDKLKRKLCAENNVRLIEVPYWIKYREMPNFIINECGKLGIDIPSSLSLDVFSVNRWNV